MSYSEFAADCHRCHESRTFRRHNAEHALHFAASVLTAGIWLPVWIYASLFRGPYRCRTCGAKHVAPARPASAYLVPFGLIAGLLLLLGVIPVARWARSPSPSKALPVAAQPNAPEVRAPVAPKPPVEVSAASLLQAFRDNPIDAEKRYGDAELVISGKAKRVPPTRPGGNTWLVFVDSKGDALAQCLLPEGGDARFLEQAGDKNAAPFTIRCRLLRYSPRPDDSLTLQMPEFVN